MLIVTVTKADGEQRSSETSFHIQNQNSLQNTILQNIKLILTGAIIIILILIVMAYRKKMIAQIYKRKIKHKIKKMIKEKNS